MYLIRRSPKGLHDMETKCCIQCNWQLPITSFEVRTDKPGHTRRGICNKCRRKRKQESVRLRKAEAPAPVAPLDPLACMPKPVERGALVAAL